MSELSDRIEDAYSWLEYATGATLNRLDIEEVRALEAKLSKMEDALEHCGYDPTDCIDCGGPPHNEWCRFWKLRDIVPILFALAGKEK